MGTLSLGIGDTNLIQNTWSHATIYSSFTLITSKIINSQKNLHNINIRMKGPPTLSKRLDYVH